MSKIKRYRIVECINVVWECEARTPSEATENYFTLVADVCEFQKLLDAGSSDIDVTEIDKNGDSV